MPTFRAKPIERMKKRLIFSVVVGLGAPLLTWILNGESSPLADYFSVHDGVPDLWLTLNVLPFLFGGVISGNHGGPPLALFTILQIVQWLIIGFVLSTFLFRVKSR